MPIRESQARADRVYKAKLDSLTIRPPKETGAAIRAAAAADGLSVQRYILRAVLQYMEQSSPTACDEPTQQ